MTTVNSTKCKCSICGLITHSIPGTIHRRCGGSRQAPLRPKLSREETFIDLRLPVLVKFRVSPEDKTYWFYRVNSGGGRFKSGPGPHRRAGKWEATV